MDLETHVISVPQMRSSLRCPASISNAPVDVALHRWWSARKRSEKRSARRTSRFPNLFSNFPRSRSAEKGHENRPTGVRLVFLTFLIAGKTWLRLFASTDSARAADVAQRMLEAILQCGPISGGRSRSLRDGLKRYRCTRALPPPASWSTSLGVAIEASPGVVMPRRRARPRTQQRISGACSRRP
jgi:hypothetical protein